MSLLKVILFVVLAGGVVKGVQWERFVKVVKLKMETSLVYVQSIPHFKCLSAAIFVKVIGRFF